MPFCGSLKIAELIVRLFKNQTGDPCRVIAVEPRGRSPEIADRVLSSPSPTANPVGPNLRVVASIGGGNRRSFDTVRASRRVRQNRACRCCDYSITGVYFVLARFGHR